MILEESITAEAQRTEGAANRRFYQTRLPGRPGACGRAVPARFGGFKPPQHRNSRRCAPESRRGRPSYTIRGAAGLRLLRDYGANTRAEGFYQTRLPEPHGTCGRAVPGAIWRRQAVAAPQQPALRAGIAPRTALLHDSWRGGPLFASRLRCETRAEGFYQASLGAPARGLWEGRPRPDWRFGSTPAFSAALTRRIAAGTPLPQMVRRTASLDIAMTIATRRSGSHESTTHRDFRRAYCRKDKPQPSLRLCASATRLFGSQP